MLLVNTQHIKQVPAANRIHKTLEDANIKLGAVASLVVACEARFLNWSAPWREKSPSEELTRPFAQPIQWMSEVPGIDRRVCENLIAEVGTDMNPFPSSGHLSSWAGISPGNQESAGKRCSGRTRKGSRSLRQTVVHAAWAANHAKDSYWAYQFKRLAARRGKKRALVAVAHSILVIVYHLLKDSRRQIHHSESGAEPSECQAE